MKLLTFKQTALLERLDDGEELVYEKGAGWWIGDDRTNGKIANALIRGCLISDCSFGDILRFTINETGRKALESREYEEDISKIKQ